MALVLLLYFPLPEESIVFWEIHLHLSVYLQLEIHLPCHDTLSHRLHNYLHVVSVILVLHVKYLMNTSELMPPNISQLWQKAVMMVSNQQYPINKN